MDSFLEHIFLVASRYEIPCKLTYEDRWWILELGDSMYRYRVLSELIEAVMHDGIKSSISGM